MLAQTVIAILRELLRDLEVAALYRLVNCVNAKNEWKEEFVINAGWFALFSCRVVYKIILHKFHTFRPLYWNLNPNNPHGCEECNCNKSGVLGGIAVCDIDDGQCICKPSVVARGCSECADGSYNLQEDNLFGCSGKYQLGLS